MLLLVRFIEFSNFLITLTICSHLFTAFRFSWKGLIFIVFVFFSLHVVYCFIWWEWICSHVLSVDPDRIGGAVPILAAQSPSARRKKNQRSTLAGEERTHTARRESRNLREHIGELGTQFAAPAISVAETALGSHQRKMLQFARRCAGRMFWTDRSSYTLAVLKRPGSQRRSFLPLRSTSRTSRLHGTN